MKIAAQLYTLRDYTKTPADVRSTFAKVKQMGYDIVQVSGMGPIDPNELQEICKTNGLEICVTHSPYDRIITDTQNLIEEHKRWECGYIGLGMMPRQFFGSYENIISFTKEIAPAIKQIKQSGLQFVYHNHAVEFEKYNGKLIIDILTENTDEGEFGLLPDTYWIMAGGVDPSEFIQQHKDRIDIVHLKDLKIKSERQQMASVGDGNLNWSKILEACKLAEVKYLPIEHDGDCPHPFESLQFSYDFLKQNYDKYLD